MEELLKQINKAIENNLYLVALQSTLTLPDICSGLSSINGKSQREDYIKWYEENFIDKQNLTGRDCYYFRCAMLHEGKMEHNKMNFAKIIFIEPNNKYIFKGNIFTIEDKKVLNIDIKSFCVEMVNCVSNWWETSRNNKIVKKNYDNMVKKHTNGLAPFIIGISVIA